MKVNNRTDFTKGSLNEKNIPEIPYELFDSWLRDALDKMVIEPYAFQLATVSKNSKPSIRTVYLRSVEENGYVFFTNYTGKKGKEITNNPNVCMNFFWAEKERQIRIEGKAEKIAPEFSDAYFASRPRKSQIGAWASSQSEILDNYQELENKVIELEKKYEGIEIPRPQNWGGYIVIPNYFEFWQGRSSRLHDRITYSKSDKKWIIKRINP
jgi:pyridoxamine 5'-phosphate oxidase